MEISAESILLLVNISMALGAILVSGLLLIRETWRKRNKNKP